MLVPLDHSIAEVSIQRRALCVELADGREVRAPLAWFPLLSVASTDDLQGHEISHDGMSVYWPALGEAVSADFLMARR